MVNRLVVNGCSYMAFYANGLGHKDLAEQLHIPAWQSLAVSGSCNDRIIRSTLRDSYQNESTFYVIGLTFLARFEIPSRLPQEPDGRWLSYNNRGLPSQICDFVPLYSDTASKQYAEFWFKMLNDGLPDIMEDLQYRILSMIDSLVHRNHRVVIFNTADERMVETVDRGKFHHLEQRKNIIDALRWRSIPWQFLQGADYPVQEEDLPWDCRHVSSGQHAHLNGFLVDYIANHDLLSSGQYRD